MMKNLIPLLIMLLAISCDRDPALDADVLADYMELNVSLQIGSDIVACAGGNENGLLGSDIEPTDVVFYPIEGATEFRYFEAENVADSANFSKYIAKELDQEALFNGYLRKFNNTPFSGEKMGIVTYKTPGKIHKCNAIRLKTNVKPTEVNHDLIEFDENGVTPSFTWSSGIINENFIYFQVISDLDGNLISGTYTVDTEFTFYDLSNVVFNITDTTSTPALEPNKNYKFSLMGVSDDNWINLFGETIFSTN